MSASPNRLSPAAVDDVGHSVEQGVRRLSREPYYLPTGNEVDVFGKCHERGLAVMLKPAPLPDNDRPFWCDDDHLKTCPTCRSGLSEFNALPTSTLDGQRDVAQDGSSTPTAAWRT